MYKLLLEVYGLQLIDGLDIAGFAQPLLALVEHQARAQTSGHAARAIIVLIAGAVVDARTGARLTPREVADRMQPDDAVPTAGPIARDAGDLPARKLPSSDRRPAAVRAL